LVKTGGLPKLANLAVKDPATIVRKKAVLALSSAVRNCPEALDEVLPVLPDAVKPKDQQGVTSDDMDALNELFRKLREHVA
jgi:hsp70-interacting protein